MQWFRYCAHACVLTLVHDQDGDPFRAKLAADLSDDTSGTSTFIIIYCPVDTQLAHAVAFANLGGDAILVVPRQLHSTTDYAHAASFALTATVDEQRGLWRKVGTAMLATLAADAPSDAPRWLSTSGAGVSYLHVRLDTRPKYYQNSDYRSVPE